jgi:hypothetical protein
MLVGGPGNTVDRNYHYSIKMDMSCIADSSHNTVRFVNSSGGLTNLDRQEGEGCESKGWLGCAKSHIYVVETASFQRDFI